MECLNTPFHKTNTTHEKRCNPDLSFGGSTKNSILYCGNIYTFCGPAKLSPKVNFHFLRPHYRFWKNRLKHILPIRIGACNPKI